MNSSRKKVLFLAPSMMGGGAERVISTLLQHLDRNRFELHLAMLHTGGVFVRDIPEDVLLHDLQVARVRYVLPAIVRLAWKLKPQTIMSTLRHLNVALILSKPFLPRNTRLLVREAALASPTLKYETKHPEFWTWFYRHLYKYADRIVGLSDAMVNDLVQNFKVPAEKTVRIYNPIDTKRVRRSAQAGTNPYSGLGPHLVAAGRFSREKGFDLLLAAMPAVIQEFPGVELVILGEGPLKSELMEQAQQLGLQSSVSFPGFDLNPWRYFRHADLFVLSSRYEGLPNVLLEVLAVGTPVVATDCPGGVREIQTCDPEMVLVAPEDPAALAAAIILSCEKTRNANHARARSLPDLSNFDLQQIVTEYSRLL